MPSRKKLSSSLFTSIVAVFAALTAITDSILESPLPFSGVWYSWVFMMEPITGILLDPYASFLATFLGVMVGHSISFRGFEEFIFTIGAPIGAAVSSFMFRRKWKIAFAYYVALLGAYFLTPVSWSLPLFGMWDIYLAFSCLIIAILIMVRWEESWNLQLPRSIYVTVLCAFIGLEADVLFRIFVFVPCQTYWLIYGYDATILQGIWAAGAIETPIKAGLSTLVATILIPPVVKAVQKFGFILNSDTK